MPELGTIRAAHASVVVLTSNRTRDLHDAPPSLPVPLDRLPAARAELARACATASDWAGGTRLAAGITAFVAGHGRRGMARGAVVVVLSDGWALDEPEEVAEAMRRLRRLAHRVVWVNPRKAAAGYVPLVGGMAAALPYCDAFVSGHSLAALEQVVAAIRDDA